jgi:hypothetical protein
MHGKKRLAPCRTNARRRQNQAMKVGKSGKGDGKYQSSNSLKADRRKLSNKKKVGLPDAEHLPEFPKPSHNPWFLER